MTTQAKITNRHHAPNQNGTSRCTVTCPICNHSRTMSYGGWTALSCKCGATLTRFATPPAEYVCHNLFRAFAAGEIKKWDCYLAVHGLVKARKITQYRARGLAAGCGISGGVVADRLRYLGQLDKF